MRDRLVESKSVSNSDSRFTAGIMMFCRAAWQRLTPVARKSLTPLFSNAVSPIRQMSFGLPASGTNMAYMVIGGSSLTAALVYAYKTINSDSARYNERIAQLEARQKRAVATLASVAEAAEIVETAVAENTTENELVVEVVDAEAEEIPEHVDTAMEVEAETAIAQAVAAEAEEPTAPVVEDVAAEASVPIAEATVIQMSDLRSTVKILAGSTGEIAAASVGDQHLVATLRLAEDNNSVEILNGLEAVEVSAEVPEKAEVVEPMIGRSDLKTEGGELEELPSALQEVEETIEVGDDRVESEADSPVVAEITAESPASSEEASATKMESILEWEESLSPEVMLSEDDTISGPAEVTSETVNAVGQQIEEDKALCQEPAATEIEHSDLTAPPTDLEEALQATKEAAGEVAMEMMLDSVEEAKPVKASEEAVESGNVTMTMAQA
ncbi:uncharacterized protein mgarpb isoform X2 [Siphateles boraxobius]|uniref:uncharacterized protein mgarpb isoform X2 n=1 Tax=Siphateles boraxobius TaxID=180520 RepID=UPI0040631836